MPSFSIFHTHNNTINLGAHRSYHQQRRYCLDNSIFHIPVTKLYPILQWEELICWQITDNYHAILWGYLSMLVFLFSFHCISPISKNQDLMKLTLWFFLRNFHPKEYLYQNHNTKSQISWIRNILGMNQRENSWKPKDYCIGGKLAFACLVEWQH